MKTAISSLIVSAIIGLVFYYILMSLGMDTASVYSGSSVRL